MDSKSLTLMVCPSRGKSMERFLEKCEASFTYTLSPIEEGEVLEYKTNGTVDDHLKFYLVEIRLK